MVDGELVIDSLLVDRGLFYGHGLFESILLDQGRTPLESLHFARLARDAPRLHLPLDIDCLREQFARFKVNLQSHNIDSGVVKVIITAGIGGAGYRLPESVIPRHLFLHRPLPPDNDAIAQGVSLREIDYRLPTNPLLAGIKHLNRLDQIMARAEWSDHYFDGIMLDTDGAVIETTCANIFVRSAQGWATPSLTQCGIKGVMRTLVMDELLPSIQQPVREAELTLHDVVSCREIFICNAVRGIMPVVNVSNKYFWTIGKDTLSVRDALAVRQQCYE